MNETAVPSPEERLSILKAHDSRRVWRSLSDRRLCVRCAKSFSGWEVRIRRQTDGQNELLCPTEGCDSSPAHWLYHGAEPHEGHSRFTQARAPEVDFSDW